MAGKKLIVSSDAHSLGNISEPENFLELDVAEDASPAELTEKLFRFLQAK